MSRDLIPCGHRGCSAFATGFFKVETVLMVLGEEGLQQKEMLLQVYCCDRCATLHPELGKRVQEWGVAQAHN